MDRSLKVSVITVVYNAAERIQATIDSVTGQDYENIEYIIKDGGSSDGTLDIIRTAAGKHPKIRFITGPDKGIYDAMNIALIEAGGDVVHFLNAGDRFASSSVVSDSMAVMRDTGSDIVYGDILYENPDGTTDVRTYPASCSGRLYYLTGDCINHQAMFTKRNMFSDAKYDTAFKICADREWMLRVKAYRPKHKMTALGFIVAVYPLDGASVINKDRYKMEADICIKRHMPWGYPVFAVFEFFRSHKALAELLHNLYKRLYIR